MEEDNDKGKKAGPGKSEFAKLIEVMESNNKSTDKIEIDGRNTRRHLLEMKNMQKVMNDFQARTVFGFENFQDMIDSQSLQGMEDNQERMSIFEEIRDALRDLNNNQTAASNDKDGGGGMIGGKIAGILAGVGAAALGIGVGVAAVMSQVPKLVEAFENADMQKIKDNIMILTTIEDELGGKGAMMAEGGALFLFLTGLGTGLAVFAAGSTFAAAVDKFSSDDWPEKIVQNVKTLLEIAELNTGDTGKVFKALSGIGFGLAAFGVGSFFAKASSSEDAETVKKAVGTLLSISDIPGADPSKAKNVMKVLSKLGGGLAAFGVGSFFAKAASNESAIQVRDSVATLLEINDIPGANPEQGEMVSDTLKSLKKGLVAFGVGSFFAKAVGEGMGANVKKQVLDLLTIGKEVDPNDTLITTQALNNLGAGLNKFAQGSFATSVSDFYGGIMDFFSGSEGPVEQAIRVGRNADNINKGANAFNSFVDSVDALSKLGRIDLDLDDTLNALVDYTRTFDKLIDGGKVKEFGTNFKTEGLAEMQKDMDAHVSSIVRLRDALQMQTPSGTTMSAPKNNTGAGLASLFEKNSELKNETPASNPNIVTGIKQGDNIRAGDTILIQNNTSSVTDSLAVDR